MPAEPMKWNDSGTAAGPAQGTPSFKNVCIYAASSEAPEYAGAARELGLALARRGHTLVFGAGGIGLMGVVVRAVRACGGHAVGVIPEKLRDMELAYEDLDELIVTETMRERKAIMEERADAFVALPGGFGTLEEMLEVLVLKQLRYHDKPLVFLNTNGFYDGLLRFFDHLIDGRFAPEPQRALYHVARTPGGVFDYFDTYTPRMD